MPNPLEKSKSDAKDREPIGAINSGRPDLFYELAKRCWFRKKSDICVRLHPSSLRSTHKHAAHGTRNSAIFEIRQPCSRRLFTKPFETKLLSGLSALR
jgi:hypothetical protein